MLCVYYKTVPLLLWTTSLYVGMHWRMLELEYIYTWYAMYHYTIAIAHSPAIQTHYPGDAICLCSGADVDWIYCVYIIKRYCVGLGWTECTFVLAHHNLAYNPPWHHQNCMLAWYYNENDVPLMVEYIYCVYIMQRHRVTFGWTVNTPTCYSYPTTITMSYGSALIINGYLERVMLIFE